MNFRNISDLSSDVAQWIPRLPGRFDCVAGVPRSGLLVANILALKLGVPITDLQGLREGRLLGTGRRLAHVDREGFFSERRRVLVVDDSIASGESLEKAREEVGEVARAHELVFGAVYVSPGKEDVCDTHFEILPGPRFFEWNIIGNHALMRQFCFDLDGVFCLDPTEEENDDGERYREFLLNAPTLYLPAAPIGFVVTSRLEKFRPETEQWLRKQGIVYDKLVMLDLPSKQERIRQRATVPYKAKAYRDSGHILFVESDPAQASQIAEATGKYVYCAGNSALYGPEGVRGLWEDQKIQFKRNVRRRVRRVGRMLKRVLKGGRG